VEVVSGLYYAPDHHFLLPHSYLAFLVRTPEVDVGDPRKVVMNELLAKIAARNLQEEAYLAKLAGLSYDIKVEDFGFRITVGGFSGNENLLLEKVVEELRRTPSEELFALYREEGQKELENFRLKHSYEQGFSLLKSTIFEKNSSPEQKLKAIEGLTYDTFKEHVQNLFATHEVTGLVLGNISSEEAQKAFTTLQQELGGTSFDDTREQKVALFPEGPFILQQKTDARGNGVIVAIENVEDSPKRYVAGEILSDLIQTPFFNELRTQQQTAYLITNLFQEVHQVLLHIFLLESHTHSSRDLLARIELFLSNFLEEQYLEIRFQKGKEGVIARLSKNDENLVEAGKRLSTLAFDEKGNFSLREKRIQAAKELTFAEFIAFTRESISGINRRRLAIFAEGVENPEILEYKDLPTPEAFQKQVKEWIATPPPN
jgi:insulysin